MPLPARIGLAFPFFKILTTGSGLSPSLARLALCSRLPSLLPQASFFHEGQGGTLYTWGGVNEVVVYGGSEKRDSNRGCLGHGDADIFTGQLLPTRQVECAVPRAKLFFQLGGCTEREVQLGQGAAAGS